jgi:hypothetical protein
MSLQTLQNLVQRPDWSKNVLVWIGDRAALAPALQGTTQVELDLLDLLPDDDSLPPARDERTELLQQRLEERLRQLRPEGSERVALRVRNAALLARYGVGLRSFYNWFGSSRTMTVLEIDRLKLINLPDTVAGAIHFDPDQLVNYFRPLLPRPDHLCTEASS